jgi:ubiquinone/menaquinone biosynthesis C-methylase UbiE
MRRRDLGACDDLAAVEALVSVSGLRLVDVGCGAGRLSRALAERGAAVLGVEPDTIQAEKNRAADPVPGLTFVEARAESLPVASGTIDGVFFFRSLHHVPPDSMDEALREAARILVPGGFLCVVEPSMEGSHFEVMRPFHDETKVRTLAQAALRRTADALFARVEGYEWRLYPQYRSFEEMVGFVTGMTFNDIRRERVETDEVRARFETGRDGEGYRFEQPMLIDLFREPAAGRSG